MKSIRLSLLVYLLSLLALGLGGVSLLTYRTAADTLREKEAGNRDTTEIEFVARSNELRSEFDHHLFRKAKLVIARHSRPTKVDGLNSLAMLASPMAPHGYLNLGLNFRLGMPPLSFRVTPLPLRLLETRSLDHVVQTVEDPSTEENDHPREVCQTFLRNGMIWERTSNLPLNAFRLQDGLRETAELMHDHYDDVVLPEVRVRRVTIKVPRGYVSPPPVPQPSPPPGSSKGPFRQPPNTGSMLAMRALSEPYFFVQYGAETTTLDRRIQALRTDRDRRLTQLSEETQNTLRELRRRLAFISGVTLLGLLGGGFVLVWLGLAPLQRLSEAVSRISTKDFQLRVDPSGLPLELQPIAHRLTDTLEQLRKAFAREKQAAQDISHDLRTPLAAIMTTLEVALKRQRSPEEYRELMEECQFSARQMSHLVERLLALARIDAGANPMQPRDSDVVQLAQYVLDLVRPLARARDIRLSLTAPDSLVTRLDPDKFGEVLTNLVHNAIDYNRPSGSINVTVRLQDNLVEILVADTGVGIKPDAKARLFERFYRADPSRHSDSPHCGLGLAIVKSYVELMLGTVDVESELGQGTTFRIRLPYVVPRIDVSQAIQAESTNV